MGQAMLRGCPRAQAGSQGLFLCRLSGIRLHLGMAPLPPLVRPR